MLIGGVDPVNMFINTTNSFDGQTSFMVSVDPVRAFCSNQLNYFRARSSAAAQRVAKENGEAPTGTRIRHTSPITGHVARVRQALDLSFRRIEDFQSEAESMIDRELSAMQFEAIVDKLYPQPKRNKSTSYDQARADLTFLFKDSETNKNITGTAWGASTRSPSGPSTTSGSWAPPT
jgi:hypothetical protein